MNKYLAAILLFAIVCFLCSCEPEPKTGAEESGVGDVVPDVVISQSENEEMSPSVEEAIEVTEASGEEEAALTDSADGGVVESEVEIASDVANSAIESSLSEDTEPVSDGSVEAEIVEPKADQLPADPAEAEVPLEEVTETAPVEESLESGAEVESAEAESAADTEDEQAKAKRPLNVFAEKCDKVLNTFVDKNGNVNYRILNRKRRALLSATDELGDLSANTLVSFKNEEEEKVFWINAHNILTLKLIINNYPIKKQWWMVNYPANSIKQILGGREKTLFRVASFSYTLNEIERDLLDKFKDPKLCFAFSYVSRSSPMLRNEVYTAEKLTAQLEDQISKFMKKPTNFRVDRQKNAVYLSSAFKLYEKIFVNSKYAKIRRYRDKKGDVRAYLNFLDSYIPEADMKFLQSEEYGVNFMVFDWSLNEKKRR